MEMSMVRSSPTYASCISNDHHDLICTAAIAASEVSLKGQIECGSQYHFTMETQAALVVPNEGSTYTVYSSTQWVGYVQAVVANLLGIATSRFPKKYYCLLKV